MRSNLSTSTLALFALAIALFSCQSKQEVSPREYPRLGTEKITEINNSGATFTGVVKTLGAAPITDHGFTWSITPNSLVENASRISLGTKQETGSFSATATFAMEAGKTHYVRTYARSGKYTVYGPSIAYTSQGSLAPVITEFSPASARRNETVTITGNNFSQDQNRLRVLFGNSTATIISATPEKIVCMVPYNLNPQPQIKITVQLAGQTVSSTTHFTLLQ